MGASPPNPLRAVIRLGWINLLKHRILRAARVGLPKSGGVADAFWERGAAKLKVMSDRQGRTKHNCLRCSAAAQIKAEIIGFAVLNRAHN